jgi:hypothetical protein
LKDEKLVSVDKKDDHGKPMSVNKTESYRPTLHPLKVSLPSPSKNISSVMKPDAPSAPQRSYSIGSNSSKPGTHKSLSTKKPTPTTIIPFVGNISSVIQPDYPSIYQRPYLIGLNLSKPGTSKVLSTKKPTPITMIPFVEKLFPIIKPNVSSIPRRNNSTSLESKAPNITKSISLEDSTPTTKIPLTKINLSILQTIAISKVYYPLVAIAHTLPTLTSKQPFFNDAPQLPDPVTTNPSIHISHSISTAKNIVIHNPLSFL